MTWIPTDMSDRISIDSNLKVKNQRLSLGRCIRQSADGPWGFLCDSDDNIFDRHDLWKYRKTAAPYVVKFIDDQLALLNVTARLTS